MNDIMYKLYTYMIQHLAKLVLVGGLALPIGGCSFFIPGNSTPLEFEDTKFCSGGAVVIRQSPDEDFPPCPDIDNSMSYVRFLTEDVENVHKSFTFSAELPSGWAVEAIPEIESLNIFDTSKEGDSNIEKSQIFVRYFEANDFLTLDTVTIHSKDDSEILTRPTIIYDIEKKSNVPTFPYQPSWRNERHSVVDVRESDDNPSIFYVFSLNPSIDIEVFEHFLYSLMFETEDMVHVEYPVEGFFERITKKPFGIFVAPEDSPVEEERFIGYHTGVDVEFEDVLEDVVVSAMVDGEVVFSKFVDGYGGLVVLEHIFRDDKYFSLYGHMDFKSALSLGKNVLAGDPIGILGDGNTIETDGERKHLHFALYRGDDIQTKGYVDNRDELDGWIDPEGFFDTISN